jgi:cytochrome c oxidase subunit II
MRTVLALVDTRRIYWHVFWIYVPIALGVFVLVVGAVLFAVLRYRGRPPEAAARWYTNNTLEAVYVGVVSLVVAFLLYVTFSNEHQEDTVSAQERPALTISVTGSQWEWTFRYPAYGITRISGAVGDAALVVPVNRPIRFELISADVIHSLWIPQLAYKRDLIPGRTLTATLDFDRTGTFGGECAVFCGLLHAEMDFNVRAVSEPRFRAWLAAARNSTRTPAQAGATTSALPAGAGST